jgi:hypothetical protein
VSFLTITLCVASQQVFVVDFVINSVWKLLDTPSCVHSTILAMPGSIAGNIFPKLISALPLHFCELSYLKLDPFQEDF